MYTIRQAAARTGIGESLLRAWQRRYAVVDPARTPSGYRLYDDEAIARLVAMRRLVEAGWSAAQAAASVRAAGAGAADAELGPATSDPAPAGRPRGSATDLVTAARGYDPVAIESALDDLFGRGSFEAVIDDLVLPAVAELGTAWADGALDIAGEHLASAAVHRRLAERFDHASVPFGAAGLVGPVLVGLPPGARHELGALAFGVALRRRGCEVLYLGPDVPAASWAAAADEIDARVAVIAVARPDDVEPAIAAAGAIAAAHPATRVALGGSGARLAAGAGIGIVRLPDRVVDAAAEVAGMLAGGRS